MKTQYKIGDKVRVISAPGCPLTTVIESIDIKPCGNHVYHFRDAKMRPWYETAQALEMVTAAHSTPVDNEITRIKQMVDRVRDKIRTADIKEELDNINIKIEGLRRYNDGSHF